MHLDEFLDLLANEITVRREKLGLTQTQAAKALGMPASDLVVFEDGKGIPDLYDWLKMCELYDFSFAVPEWTNAKPTTAKATAKPAKAKASTKKTAKKVSAKKKK